MESNPLGIEYLEFGTDPLNQYMKMVFPQRKDILYFNPAHLTEGKMYFIKDLEEHYQAYICRAEGANVSFTLKNFCVAGVLCNTIPYA